MSQSLTPTFLHGKETEIVLCQHDITCFVNNIDLTQDIDLPETTTYCNDTRAYINGLRNATGSIGGFIDDDYDEGIDAILQATFNTSSASIWTDAPNGFTKGNITYLFQALVSSYNTTQPVDGVQSWTADLQLSGDLHRGVSLHAIAAEIATVAAADGVDMENFYGGVTTTQGLVAHLHVVLASGTTPTLDVEIHDSADDITYLLVPNMVFTQATGVTCERIEIANGANTTEQYLAADITIAGTTPSFKFCVEVAVKP